MYFKQLLDERYGCASHVASRQSYEAAIVDPSLDVGPYEALLRERDFQLRYGYCCPIHASRSARGHLSNHPKLGWRIEQQYLLFLRGQAQLRSWQTNTETTPLADHALNRHRPIHRLDPLFDKRKAQSRATSHARALRLVETFPDMGQVCWRDTFARIFHLEHKRFGFHSHHYSDDPTRRGMPHSIVEQILQYLF